MTGETTAARRLPAGLLGALAAVVCVESLISGRADGLADYQGLGVRFARAEAVRSAPGCGVLALGDSVVKFGFDPAEVQRRLGVPAYNLAVPGTPPPLTYALLRRALKAGARPSAVVVGHMTLAGDPGVHAAEFGELLDPGECLELAWVADDPGLFASLAANRLLPSVRYRHALRMRVRAALQGVATGPGRSAGLLSGWAAERGMERRTVSGAFDGRMEPKLERSVYSEPWRVLWVYEHYVRRIAGLAAAYDVPVYWLVAPIAPEAQARRDALGLDAHHSKNLRAVAARSPNLTVLDARHAGYPASAFFDSCHLNDRGAGRLSADVAAAVDRRGGGGGGGGGGRWVALPPYAGTAPVVGAGAGAGRALR